MSDVRFYYGVVIDDTLKGVRQYLRALDGAAKAEASKQESGDKALSAALAKLDATLKALEA